MDLTTPAHGNEVLPTSQDNKHWTNFHSQLHWRQIFAFFTEKAFIGHYKTLTEQISVAAEKFKVSEEIVREVLEGLDSLGLVKYSSNELTVLKDYVFIDPNLVDAQVRKDSHANLTAAVLHNCEQKHSEELNAFYCITCTEDDIVKASQKIKAVINELIAESENKNADSIWTISNSFSESIKVLKKEAI